MASGSEWLEVIVAGMRTRIYSHFIFLFEPFSASIIWEGKYWHYHEIVVQRTRWACEALAHERDDCNRLQCRRPVLCSRVWVSSIAECKRGVPEFLWTRVDARSGGRCRVGQLKLQHVKQISSEGGVVPLPRVVCLTCIYFDRPLLQQPVLTVASLCSFLHVYSCITLASTLALVTRSLTVTSSEWELCHACRIASHSSKALWRPNFSAGAPNLSSDVVETHGNL